MWCAALLVGFAGLAAAAAPSAVEPAGRDEIWEQIHRHNAVYIKAYADGDAARIAGLYDPEGARLSPGGVVVHGREAILTATRTFLGEVGTVRVIIRPADLWVVDDLAYESGEWSWKFTPGDREPRRLGGRYVTVWRRQPDGGWGILADLSVPGT